MVRSAGTSGGPSKKKKRPLPARSNAASSLEESRQRCKVSTFGSSGLRTNSGLCMGLKSLHKSDPTMGRKLVSREGSTKYLYFP